MELRARRSFFASAERTELFFSFFFVAAPVPFRVEEAQQSTLASEAHVPRVAGAQQASFPMEIQEVELPREYIWVFFENTIFFRIFLRPDFSPLGKGEKS